MSLKNLFGGGDEENLFLLHIWIIAFLLLHFNAIMRAYCDDKHIHPPLYAILSTVESSERVSKEGRKIEYFFIYITNCFSLSLTHKILWDVCEADYKSFILQDSLKNGIDMMTSLYSSTTKESPLQSL